jgi:hypothetical protein
MMRFVQRHPVQQHHDHEVPVLRHLHNAEISTVDVLQHHMWSNLAPGAAFFEVFTSWISTDQELRVERFLGQGSTVWNFLDARFSNAR